MKAVRFALALVMLGAVAGLAYVGQESESAGGAQVQAAQAFLGSLTPEQKEKATFAFDNKERFNWNFTPQQDAERRATRKGLPLEDMSAAQKQKALELVRAGTSREGDETAKVIMSLEAILRDQEAKGKMVRNPEWYFFTIFGTPSKTGSWGWRVEGHHLSINVTLDGAQVVTQTPFFFGANPAIVKSGPKQGMKVLGPAQDLAAQIFASLDADQRKQAEQTKAFPEPGEKTLSPKVGDAVGLPAARMNASQKEALVKLLQHYTGRMPREIGDREMKMVRDAGFDKVHFAYHGGVKDGEKRSYRIQGPTFVVEFLNEQNDSAGNQANHIHSAWRHIKGDFGLN